MELNEYDYELLTDTWSGVRGAAFNSVYEDLQEEGLINFSGKPTKRGLRAIKEYEERIKRNDI